MESALDKKKWLAQYRETFGELERLRARALHAMTEEEAWRQITSLTVGETPWRARRDWSGLVEQQYYFANGRKA